MAPEYVDRRIECNNSSPAPRQSAGRIDFLAGRGARLTQVAKERGITFEIAAIWPGDRSYERKLKNKKSAPRFCPICRKAHEANQLVMDLEDDLL